MEKSTSDSADKISKKSKQAIFLFITATVVFVACLLLFYFLIIKRKGTVVAINRQPLSNPNIHINSKIASEEKKSINVFKNQTLVNETVKSPVLPFADIVTKLQIIEGAPKHMVDFDAKTELRKIPIPDRIIKSGGRIKSSRHVTSDSQGRLLFPIVYDHATLAPEINMPMVIIFDPRTGESSEFLFEYSPGKRVLFNKDNGVLFDARAKQIHFFKNLGKRSLFNAPEAEKSVGEAVFPDGSLFYRLSDKRSIMIKPDGKTTFYSAATGNQLLLFDRYVQAENFKDITGFDMSKMILEEFNLKDVLQMTPASLIDSSTDALFFAKSPIITNEYGKRFLRRSSSIFLVDSKTQTAYDLNHEGLDYHRAADYYSLVRSNNQESVMLLFKDVIMESFPARVIHHFTIFKAMNSEGTTADSKNGRLHFKYSEVKGIELDNNFRMKNLITVVINDGVHVLFEKVSVSNFDQKEMNLGIHHMLLPQYLFN